MGFVELHLGQARVGVDGPPDACRIDGSVDRKKRRAGRADLIERVMVVDDMVDGGGGGGVIMRDKIDGLGRSTFQKTQMTTWSVKSRLSARPGCMERHFEQWAGP